MTVVRDAATVMLVRDAPELQVFMLRRNLNSEWVGGVHVFPGGAVDPEDRSADAARRAADRTDVAASALLGTDHGGLGFWVAAIRESFEEAGVLLGHTRRGGPIDFPRLDAGRLELNRGERSFLDVLADQDLVLDVGALHVFSHWITPAGMARRYDTWFFVAAAPPEHSYVHDETETIASVWLRPAEAIARADAGEIELVFPTRRSLEALAEFTTTSDLLTHARGASAAPPTTLCAVDGNGARIPMPGDAAGDASLRAGAG